MAQTITLKATDGSDIQFVDNIIGSGGMKDVYFSPDKTYVVAFFRDNQDYNSKERLTNITGIYRDRIFNAAGGDYWKDVFCWPTKMVEYKGKLGVVCPTYNKKFYFTKGSINNDFLQIKGSEKQGKWFASAKNQNKFLAPEEKGDWFKYFQICINISRAVRRMHAAGLAHSDLSYKNVLIDPSTGSASLIDIDGLVVPGKYPPDVLGTPDFIAPEVIATKHLNLRDFNRKLPSIATDRHALAVMIYMYLLNRHPLRGGKVNDLDSAKDEELSMGTKALFVEHPTDRSNQVKVKQLQDSQLPQSDPNKRPYTICGPYLKTLFDKAFIEGLHDPSKRPSANEWEQALLKTVDLMQPCTNSKCANKWFVFDNTRVPSCPFCQTTYKQKLPILNFYSMRRAGSFTPDDYRLMVYNNQYLYAWHTNRNISPNERMTAEEKKPLGYFVFFQNKWLLINQKMMDLEVINDDNTKQIIKINESIELKDGLKFILSKADGGRLVVVQVVN